MWLGGLKEALRGPGGYLQPRLVWELKRFVKGLFCLACEHRMVVRRQFVQEELGPNLVSILASYGVNKEIKLSM